MTIELELPAPPSRPAEIAPPPLRARPAPLPWRRAPEDWERLEPQLKKFGKPYEAIEEKRQGHGFRDEKSSIGFYERLETFFAKHLAPEGRVKVGDQK